MTSTSDAGARSVQNGQVSVGGELFVPWSLGSALLRSADAGRTWSQFDFPHS